MLEQTKQTVSCKTSKMPRGNRKRLRRVQPSGPSERAPGASGTHPAPEKPAPVDTPINAPNSNATDEGSPLASAPSAWKDFKTTSEGVLGIILKISKEASAAFPPAQAAVGGVQATKEVFDVSMRHPGSEVYNLS